jgi:pilus assembly protein Flp/PilA
MFFPEGTHHANRHNRITKNQGEEKMRNLVKKFIKDEEGATAVEYGVLVALIIALCIVVIQVIGTKIESAFEKVNTNLK